MYTVYKKPPASLGARRLPGKLQCIDGNRVPGRPFGPGARSEHSGKAAGARENAGMSSHGTSSTASASRASPCPCGLARPYLACCGRWHEGPQHLQAPDAQALMRSNAHLGKIVLKV